MFVTILLCLWNQVIQAAPGVPGNDWTDEEVGLIKAELWSIMANPDLFTKVFTGKKKKKERCGEACWKGCDDFDKSKYYLHILSFLLMFVILMTFVFQIQPILFVRIVIQLQLEPMPTVALDGAMMMYFLKDQCALLQTRLFDLRFMIA